MAIRDRFIESVDTPLTSHSPDTSDTGSSWSMSGVWNITEPEGLRLVTAATHKMAIIDSGYKDGFAEVEITANAINNNGFGLAFRYVSDSSTLVAWHNVSNGICSIRSYDGSTFTTLATETVAASGTSKFKLCVVFSNTDISLYLNEVKVLTTNSSFNETSSKVGLIDNSDIRRYSNFRTLTRIEKYDILPAAGQSNMRGLGLKDDVVDVFDWRTACLDLSGELIPAYNPLPHTGALVNTMGLATVFCNNYASSNLSSGRYVLVLPTAKGGSSFQAGDWNQGDPSYNTLVSLVNTAKSLNGLSKLVCMLWHQGESDAQNDTEAALHKPALIAMIAALRSDFSLPTMPIVMGELGQFLFAAPQVPSYKIVNTGMTEIAKLDSFVKLALATNLNDLGDKLHFDSAGLRVFGYRYFIQYISMGGIGPTPTPTGAIQLSNGLFHYPCPKLT